MMMGRSALSSMDESDEKADELMSCSFMMSACDGAIHALRNDVCNTGCDDKSE